MDKFHVKAVVNEDSLYNLFKDKEIPQNLSANDIEWEIITSDTETNTFILNAKALKNEVSF